MNKKAWPGNVSRSRPFRLKGIPLKLTKDGQTLRHGLTATRIQSPAGQMLHQPGVGPLITVLVTTRYVKANKEQ